MFKLNFQHIPTTLLRMLLSCAVFCIQPGFAQTDRFKDQNRLLSTSSSSTATGTVVGQVTDAETGIGIAHVTVTSESNEGRTLTDLQGNYRLGELPAETVILHFSVGAYIDHQVPINISRNSETRVNVETHYIGGSTERHTIDTESSAFDPETRTFNPGDTSTTTGIASDNPAILTGRVLDAVTRGTRTKLYTSGGVTPGGDAFKVEAMNDRNYTNGDLQGRYQLILTPGRKRIIATADGYEYISKWFDLEPGARETFDFYLRPKPASVEGRVNQGQEGVLVKIGNRQTTTDGNGFYRFEGLPAHESLVVTASTENRRGTQVSLKLRAGETRLNFDIRLASTPNPHDLSGVVKDQATGRPLAGVMVVASTAIETRVCTGADGKFTFRRLNRDLGHEIDFYRDGYRSVRALSAVYESEEKDFLRVDFNVTPNMYNHVILLPPDASARVAENRNCGVNPPSADEAIDPSTNHFEFLHGKVRDASSGQPLSGVAVEFMDQRVCTDTRGNYRIEHLPVRTSAPLRFKRQGYLDHSVNTYVAVAHEATRGSTAESQNEVLVALRPNPNDANQEDSRCQEIIRSSRSIAEVDDDAPLVQGLELLLVDSRNSKPLVGVRVRNTNGQIALCSNTAGRVIITENITAIGGTGQNIVRLTLEKNSYKTVEKELASHGDISQNRHLINMTADAAYAGVTDCKVRVILPDDKKAAVIKLNKSTPVAVQRIVEKLSNKESKSTVGELSKNPKLVKDVQAGKQSVLSKTSLNQSRPKSLSKQSNVITGIPSASTLKSLNKPQARLAPATTLLPKNTVGGFGSSARTLLGVKNQPSRLGKSGQQFTTIGTASKTFNRNQLKLGKGTLQRTDHIGAAKGSSALPKASKVKIPSGSALPEVKALQTSGRTKNKQTAVAGSLKKPTTSRQAKSVKTLSLPAGKPRPPKSSVFGNSTATKAVMPKIGSSKGINASKSIHGIKPNKGFNGQSTLTLSQRRSTLKTAKIKDSSRSTKVKTAMKITPPDLQFKAKRMASFTVNPGKSFTFTANGLNGSRGLAKQVSLDFLSSPDATISSKDKRLKSRSYGTIVAGKKINYRIKYTAPNKPGTYYYGACMRTQSRENNLRNNCTTAMKLVVREKVQLKPVTMPLKKSTGKARKTPVKATEIKQNLSQ